MKTIANFLFEAMILKKIPRAGYHFLGAGKESVAEHTYITTMIAFVMSQMTNEINSEKLVLMCLVHDLPEARMSDLNYVQKKYVTGNEKKAVKDQCSEIFFGSKISDLIDEFNARETFESKLAYDADQIAFILELKALSDVGNKPPEKWLPTVIKRLQTDIGKKLCQSIMDTSWDSWWFDKFIDKSQ